MSGLSTLTLLYDQPKVSLPISTLDFCGSKHMWSTCMSSLFPCRSCPNRWPQLQTFTVCLTSESFLKWIIKDKKKKGQKQQSQKQIFLLIECYSSTVTSYKIQTTLFIQALLVVIRHLWFLMQTDKEWRCDNGDDFLHKLILCTAVTLNYKKGLSLVVYVFLYWTMTIGCNPYSRAAL